MEGALYTLIPFIFRKMPWGFLRSCWPLFPRANSPCTDILTSWGWFPRHLVQVHFRSIHSLGKVCTVPLFQRQAGLLGGDGCLPFWALVWLWASIRPCWSTWVLVPIPHRGAAVRWVHRAVVLRDDTHEFQAPTGSLLDLWGRQNEENHVNGMLYQWGHRKHPKRLNMKPSGTVSRQYIQPSLAWLGTESMRFVFSNHGKTQHWAAKGWDDLSLKHYTLSFILFYF